MVLKGCLVEVGVWAMYKIINIYLYKLFTFIEQYAIVYICVVVYKCKEKQVKEIGDIQNVNK